jgi:hypothetical protein
MLGLAVVGQQEATDVRVRFADTSLAVGATALVLASKARAWAAIVHRRRVGIDLRRRSRTVEAGDAGDRSAFSVPGGEDSGSKLGAAASARVRSAQLESLRGHDLLIGEERLGSRRRRRSGRTLSSRRLTRARTRPTRLPLIGQAWVASTAAGRGPLLLALDGGPVKDQPVPTVVRCRERRQDVAPVEGLVYEHPQRYLRVGALSSVLTLEGERRG